MMLLKVHFLSYGETGDIALLKNHNYWVLFRLHDCFTFVLSHRHVLFTSGVRP